MDQNEQLFGRSTQLQDVTDFVGVAWGTPWFRYRLSCDLEPSITAGHPLTCKASGNTVNDLDPA